MRGGYRGGKRVSKKGYERMCSGGRVQGWVRE